MTPVTLTQPSQIPAHGHRNHRFGFEATDNLSDSDHTTSSLASPMSLSVDRFDLASLLLPQDTEEARRRWGAQLNRLYPSNTIYVDYYRVDGGEWPSDRRSAAHGLFNEFQEVMRMCENESERARICSNYTLAQAVVTPVHRLPEEIVTEVFMICHGYYDGDS